MHKTALGAEFTVDWKYVNNAVDAVDNLRKEGYIVYSFYTYDEALMHKDDDVHLWLIDIMLDRASGFELFNEIKLVALKCQLFLCLHEIRNLIGLLD